MSGKNLQRCNDVGDVTLFVARALLACPCKNLVVDRRYGAGSSIGLGGAAHREDALMWGTCMFPYLLHDVVLRIEVDDAAVAMALTDESAGINIDALVGIDGARKDCGGIGLHTVEKDEGWNIGGQGTVADVNRWGAVGVGTQEGVGKHLYEHFGPGVEGLVFVEVVRLVGGVGVLQREEGRQIGVTGSLGLSAQLDVDGGVGDGSAEDGHL